MNPLLVLLAILLVGIGGAGGSVLRWTIAEYGQRLAERWAPADSVVQIRPWLTFTANIVACFALGVVVARLGSAAGAAELVYLLLSVGFCGGLSTLSTAAMDVVDLVRRGTSAIAVGYLMLSTGAGMAMLWAGLVIAT